MKCKQSGSDVTADRVNNGTHGLADRRTLKETKGGRKELMYGERKLAAAVVGELLVLVKRRWKAMEERGLPSWCCKLEAGERLLFYACNAWHETGEDWLKQLELTPASSVAFALLGPT